MFKNTDYPIQNTITPVFSHINIDFGDFTDEQPCTRHAEQLHALYVRGCLLRPTSTAAQQYGYPSK